MPVPHDVEIPTPEKVVELLAGTADQRPTFRCIHAGCARSYFAPRRVGHQTQNGMVVYRHTEPLQDPLPRALAGAEEMDNVGLPEGASGQTIDEPWEAFGKAASCTA